MFFRSTAILVCLVALAGCSSSNVIDIEVSAAEPYPILREALSPCVGGPPEFDTPWYVSFTEVDAWYRVDQYSDLATPVLGSTEPSRFEAISVESGEPTTLELVVYAGDERSIQWGVDKAPELYVGVYHSSTPNLAAVIMAVLPDGSAFFPGECSELIVGDSLRQTLGDQGFSTFVENALELTGDDLMQYVSTSTR